VVPVVEPAAVSVRPASLEAVASLEEEELAGVPAEAEEYRLRRPAMMGSKGLSLSGHRICLMFPPYFFRTDVVFEPKDLAAAAKGRFSVCSWDLITNSS
jgi:hypothetical protein